MQGSISTAPGGQELSLSPMILDEHWLLVLPYKQQSQPNSATNSCSTDSKWWPLCLDSDRSNQSRQKVNDFWYNIRLSQLASSRLNCTQLQPSEVMFLGSTDFCRRLYASKSWEEPGNKATKTTSPWMVRTVCTGNDPQAVIQVQTEKKFLWLSGLYFLE